MDITHPAIIEYMLNITPERDSVLAEMELYAKEHNFPIIGPLVGKMLFILAKISNAKRILELGSGFGYSAYWFAKATGKEGKIICTEENPGNVSRGLEYLALGGLHHQVRFLTGDALELIDTVEGEFDIIFNDLDKHQYPAAFQKALPKLRTGGLLISDNVLWSGRILDKEPDENTAGILTYNRLINSTSSLATSIIPLRDGVSVSIKL